METLVEQNLATAGRGDHALDLLNVGVLAMQAIGHQIDVVNRFVFGRVGHITDFNPAQILHPTHALNTRHDQAQWIAILRAQHFAVLPPSHQNFPAHDQAHGDRARHAGAICSLGQDEFGLFEVCSGHLQQRAQRHTRVFAARQHAMGVLHGGHSHIGPFHPAVCPALDKVHPANGRQAHQLIHREDHGLFHESSVVAVDHQAMFIGLNIPPALVMALKMQAVGCDDAKQALQGAKAHTGSGNTRQSGAFAALKIFLMHTGHAIAQGGYRLPQAFGVGWHLQNVGIALTRYRIALRTGLARSSHSRGKRTSQKASAASCHFCNLLTAEKTLRGGPNESIRSHSRSLEKTVFI